MIEYIYEGTQAYRGHACKHDLLHNYLTICYKLSNDCVKYTQRSLFLARGTFLNRILKNKTMKKETPLSSKGVQETPP